MEVLGQTPHWNSVSMARLEKWSVFFSLLQIWLQCTLIMFSSTRAILAVGAYVSQACFALCLLQLQLFTPQNFTSSQFSYQSRLQNFKSTCIKLHRNVYRAVFHNFKHSFHSCTLQFLQKKRDSTEGFSSKVLGWAECTTFLLVTLLTHQRGESSSKSPVI